MSIPERKGAMTSQCFSVGRLSGKGIRTEGGYYRLGLMQGGVLITLSLKCHDSIMMTRFSIIKRFFLFVLLLLKEPREIVNL